MYLSDIPCKYWPHGRSAGTRNGITLQLFTLHTGIYSFFLSMLHGANHSPLYATSGDYTCNDITFEIGGKNKGFEQVSNLETKAFVVKDDILQSDGKRSIPLYLWGFLY